MLQIDFTPTPLETRGSAMPREMTEWSMWQFNGMPRPMEKSRGCRRDFVIVGAAVVALFWGQYLAKKEMRKKFVPSIKSSCDEALMYAIFPQFWAFSGDCEMNQGESHTTDLVARVSTNVAATHPRATGMGRTRPQSCCVNNSQSPSGQRSNAAGHCII